jgi:hypothetical protein
VRVAIERPDGLLVGGLLAAGITLIAIHPNQVAAARDRFRAAAWWGTTDRGRCVWFELDRNGTPSRSAAGRRVTGTSRLRRPSPR